MKEFGLPIYYKKFELYLPPKSKFQVGNELTHCKSTEVGNKNVFPHSRISCIFRFPTLKQFIYPSGFFKNSKNISRKLTVFQYEEKDTGLTHELDDMSGCFENTSYLETGRN